MCASFVNAVHPKALIHAHMSGDTTYCSKMKLTVIHDLFIYMYTYTAFPYFREFSLDPTAGNF
jgi:hypothetical protein